eukprot:8210332-Alexandrium_andersonii.AAC.1
MMLWRKSISSPRSSVFCSSSTGSATDTPSPIGPDGPAREAPALAGPPRPASSPGATSPSGVKA